MKKRRENDIKNIFASEVFSDEIMKKYMSKKAYKEFLDVIDNGNELNSSLANEVAKAMKNWAIKKGATHYTHWFQPLTEYTAEKHDSFISINKKGKMILDFSGKSLCKGEADASSFPSGGIRATFEARGYTVLDCSSPSFIKRSSNGAGVLCIPTAFCAYTGEALDKKTPLLRSMNNLNEKALKLLRLLGDNKTKKVIPVVGGEQEYFLIDKGHYNLRDDLKYTGRTLFGASPLKGQEKSDQYYASIKTRVADFMADLNIELWKLGVTAKTEHNEAAPSQHELAPVYTSANIATDQNQLIMEIMKKVAEKHNLVCLLHEKPFNGVNGSGKHNNYSLMSNEGINLLEPHKDPALNRIFLILFVAMIAGVDEYSDLLCMSAFSAGNDNRLGGNEAPPSIMSVYVGETIENVLNNIINGKDISKKDKEIIKMGLPAFPLLKKDYSDRNRTSPFAFTGNKFEFRMVGSSASLATSNIVLNLIMAHMIDNITEEIKEGIKTNDLDHVVSSILAKYIKKHSRIIYNGNNYSSEWRNEAKNRGLSLINNALDSYKCLLDEKIIALYEKENVLTKKELLSRYEIFVENYAKTINIEALTMLDMAKRQIMPAILNYQGKLANNLLNLKKINESLGNVQDELILKIENLSIQANKSIKELEDEILTAKKTLDFEKKAMYYRDFILKTMGELRKSIDELELIVEKESWPFPTIGDILFYN